MIKNTSNLNKILPIVDKNNNNTTHESTHESTIINNESTYDEDRHSSMEKGMSTYKSSEINEIRYGSFLLGNSSSSFCIIS